MSSKKKLPAIILIAAALLFAWMVAKEVAGQQRATTAYAQSSCQEIFKPGDMPAPALIDFDDMANAAVVGDNYRPTFGVRFEDSKTTRALIYGNEPAKTASRPNMAINDAVSPNTSSNVPMNIWFDEPKTHVGFYIGNGETQQIQATLLGYNAKGTIICRAFFSPVPEPDTHFMGIYDPSGSIVRITLDYGETTLSEAIDNLYFSPRAGIPPTRTPQPTWTPYPSPTPTQGPAPTPTAIVPMIPYNPPVAAILPPVFLSYDLSIHGIEITQGIQCFNTSQGLGSCADNSLPVVTKKDATARIYLKLSGFSLGMNNVPVRLHIRANNVWYTANTSGRATPLINQIANDSANVYFNVNFSNDVPVDFYAVVDPDGLYTESNESNNRYPASGYITLDFRKRDTLKIVGQRLRYHPSGYSGTQYAGGWAVNGGAADWFEQVLPLRNNAVNYSVKSGYLDWTTSLGSGSGQHSLIQTLNVNWIIDNAFAWLFSGAFVGADHVYGWAPNAGYSGGHADMPVYPHAGGYGIVGIGTDRAGTNTDNPGGGALIFGHELVHDYNVLHTNTADACGSNDSSSTFPYSSSSIQEVGFNPFTGKIYDPATTHDLMSYCPAGGSKQGWISPFTWNTMFNKLNPGLEIYYRSERGINTRILTPTASQESLVVDASIFNPLYEPQQAGALGDLYRVATGVVYTPPSGDYAVELRNAQGEALLTQPFVVNFESEYDAHSDTPHGPEGAPPFPPDPTVQVDVSFIIPWVDGTTSIALTHLGQDLDVRQVSTNPPQVFFTSPTGAETWLPGSTHTLTWDGQDLDGDSLSYSLFYSQDGGASWALIQSGISTPSYQVDTDSMAGGADTRFRVVATDGVNTDYDETAEAISIPNHAPEATVLNPTTGGFHLPGSLIVFQGIGVDMEDGTLPDSSLVWSDDIQGGLGTGPSVAINNLQIGTHTVTLTATDSNGVPNSTSVTFEVTYPVFMPSVNR